MEEVLLLGLKDEQVVRSCSTIFPQPTQFPHFCTLQGYLSFWNDNISFVLRGCILMELSMRNRIQCLKEAAGRHHRKPAWDRYIEVVDDTLTGEILLDEALKMMKTSAAAATIRIGTSSASDVAGKHTISEWIDLLSGSALLLISVSLSRWNMEPIQIFVSAEASSWATGQRIGGQGCFTHWTQELSCFWYANASRLRSNCQATNNSACLWLSRLTWPGYNTSDTGADLRCVLCKCFKQRFGPNYNITHSFTERCMLFQMRGTSCWMVYKFFRRQRRQHKIISTKVHSIKSISMRMERRDVGCFGCVFEDGQCSLMYKHWLNLHLCWLSNHFVDPCSWKRTFFHQYASDFTRLIPMISIKGAVACIFHAAVWCIESCWQWNHRGLRSLLLQRITSLRDLLLQWNLQPSPENVNSGGDYFQRENEAFHR